MGKPRPVGRLASGLLAATVVALLTMPLGTVGASHGSHGLAGLIEWFGWGRNAAPEDPHVDEEEPAPLANRTGSFEGRWVSFHYDADAARLWNYTVNGTPFLESIQAPGHERRRPVLAGGPPPHRPVADTELSGHSAQAQASHTAAGDAPQESSDRRQERLGSSVPPPPPRPVPACHGTKHMTAPLTMRDLPAHFASLSEQDLRRSWVACVVEASLTDHSTAELAAALVAVRDRDSTPDIEIDGRGRGAVAAALVAHVAARVPERGDSVRLADVAMAALSPEPVQVAGLDLTMNNAAEGGDTFENNGRTIVVLQNDHAAQTREVTIPAQTTARPARGRYPAQQVPDIVVEVPPESRIYVGPIATAYSDAVGTAHLAYDDHADVSVGVIQFPA